jgi:hypothetical protein
MGKEKGTVDEGVGRVGMFSYCYSLFYVVRTVHFGMKLYNDQRNAQVFNLLIYLLLPYMFRGFY